MTYKEQSTQVQGLRRPGGFCRSVARPPAQVKQEHAGALERRPAGGTPAFVPRRSRRRGWNVRPRTAVPAARCPRLMRRAQFAASILAYRAKPVRGFRGPPVHTVQKDHDRFPGLSRIARGYRLPGTRSIAPGALAKMSPQPATRCICDSTQKEILVVSTTFTRTP